MTMSVNIEVARRPAALTLPADAVREAMSKPWVMKVKEGRTVRQPIELGVRGEGAVEVVAGISEGDAVVLPSAGTVPEGKRVRSRPVSETGAGHVF